MSIGPTPTPLPPAIATVHVTCGQDVNIPPNLVPTMWEPPTLQFVETKLELSCVCTGAACQVDGVCVPQRRDRGELSKTNTSRCYLAHAAVKAFPRPMRGAISLHPSIIADMSWRANGLPYFSDKWVALQGRVAAHRSCPQPLLPTICSPTKTLHGTGIVDWIPSRACWSR